MKVDHKIGSSSLQNIDAAKTSKTSSKPGLDKTPFGEDASALGGSAKVDLSDRAQMMAKAKEIASRPAVDEAKVARLQKMIDEGKYQTDAAAISDKLIDEHMSFPD